MIFKILLSRSVQTPNSDKNWQTSCPLQTFVCNISRHLEFHYRTRSPGQLCLRVAGFPGHWVDSLGRWVTKCDPVPCLHVIPAAAAGESFMKPYFRRDVLPLWTNLLRAVAACTVTASQGEIVPKIAPFPRGIR